MAICRWWSRGWLVVCLLLALLFKPADAATLLNLRWLPDDGAFPPADTIQLDVLLMPGEQAVTVRARAVQVLGDDGELVLPVDRRNVTPRWDRPIWNDVVPLTQAQPTASPLTSAGDYVAEVFVLRPAGIGADLPAHVVQQITVPHADLQLPDGLCRLAFEVAVISSDGTAFIQPTPMREFLVTGEHRQALATKTSEKTATAAKPPAAALSSLESTGRRMVYFATNRKVAKAESQSLARFGGNLSTRLSFGQSQVDIPVASHRVGNLEGPACNWWSRKAGDHFCVELLQESTRPKFVEQVSRGDALLFVHGFNNSLEDALLRTAQLRHDVEFAGPAISFSWPSAGSMWSYRDDETRLGDSATALADLLAALSSPAADGSAPKRKLHILAHSMGTRLLLDAVCQLNARKPAPAIKLGNVVLAAADVNQQIFAERLPVLIKMADRVTYYYSAEDVALKASKRVYENNPVGLSPWFAPALDTINADEANSAWVGWGHRYYAGSDRVLLDINLLVNRRLDPPRRQPPLKPDAQRSDHLHWLFAEMAK